VARFIIAKLLFGEVAVTLIWMFPANDAVGVVPITLHVVVGTLAPQSALHCVIAPVDTLTIMTPAEYGA
jgi:hypothetical protein